ncbi:MAG: nitroreductase family protein, partial [Anaerolineaceae bacterium]
FHRLQRLAELETAPFTANRSFRHFWVGCEDTIIAAQSMCTAADALGLGSVYLGTVSEYIPQLRERLNLPQGVFPLVLVCFGYPKKAPALRKKYPARVLVHEETYQEMDDEALLDAMREKYGDRMFQINPERLKTIETVCRQTRGAEFAEKCLARVRRDGCIMLPTKCRWIIRGFCKHCATAAFSGWMNIKT